MSANNTTWPSQCQAGPPYLTWTLRIVYSVIFFLGLFGNAVVCLAIVKRKQIQTSIGMFTFNLAFHDLVLVVVYVPTQMIALENCFKWTLGDFMCHLVYFILPLSLSVSIGTLLAITGDRFRVIVFPIKSKLTKTTVKLIIAAIWIVSVVIDLPLAVVSKVTSPQPNTEYCAELWPNAEYAAVYWISMFVIQYLLPLAIIAVLAGSTARSLQKNSRPAATESCERSDLFRKTMRKRVKQTQKITKMLIGLVVLYAICMLPQHVVYTFWTRYGNLSRSRYREVLNIAANIFPIANSALNPIAYGTLNKEFKAVFRGLFSCACCRRSGRSSIFIRNVENTAYKWEVLSTRNRPLLQKWVTGASHSSETRHQITKVCFLEASRSEPVNQAQTCLVGESMDSTESCSDGTTQEEHSRLEKYENAIKRVNTKETPV